MYKISECALDKWQQYAAKLEEYASGNTVGSPDDLEYGTCRYCEYSSPEMCIPAHNMFNVLEEISPIARRLSALYNGRQRGRIPERIQLAADLAVFIRKELIDAQ